MINLVHILILLILSLSVITVLVDSIELNIHIKLVSNIESTLCTVIDNDLHSIIPDDDIYLCTINQPHVTLYLTDFGNNTNKVINTIQSLINRSNSRNNIIKPINLYLTDFISSSNYGFWSIQLTQELQLLSDLIVNSTMKYINPNQIPPEWINKLPEPERTIKLNLFKLYGSPNVFNGFQPHITIAYTNKYIELLNHTLSTAIFPIINYNSYSIILGIGSVGLHGTVLRGKDYAEFNLSQLI